MLKEGYSCLLGFNVDKIPVDTRLGVGYNYYPSEECPKPKTLTRFVELSLGEKDMRVLVACEFMELYAVSLEKNGPLMYYLVIS